MELALNVEGLSVEYAALGYWYKALDGVCLKARKGEILGIMGESGAGKSTFAMSLLRLLPSCARIRCGRLDVVGYDMLHICDEDLRSIRGRVLCAVFQDPSSSLDPLMRISRQVAETVISHERITKKKARVRALDALSDAGFPVSRADEYPHRLSGGMRQRAAIAAAIACRPSLIVADEPVSSLDFEMKTQTLLLFKSFRERFGTTFVIISHDASALSLVCDRIVHIRFGRVFEDCSIGI